MVERERVDQIVVTMGKRGGTLPVKLLLHLKSRGVLIRDGADVYETLTGKVPLNSLRLSWLLSQAVFEFRAPCFCTSVRRSSAAGT